MDNIHKQEWTTTKSRHICKLDNLILKKRKAEPDHTHINSKLIHNMSRHNLTQVERSVLAKGLNYAVTPSKIPHKDFILVTELACEKINNPGQKAALRNEVAGILKTAKLPPSNITKQEVRDIKTAYNHQKHSQK